MDDEQSLESLPPEQQKAAQDAADEDGAGPPDSEAAHVAEASVAPEVAEPEAVASESVASEAAATQAPASEAEVASAQAEAEAEEEASQAGQDGGLPRGSIAAVGERLGQRVAQISETAGDKVAHAGEAAGQKVILASEAAEGTVAEAQTRAVEAKQRIAEQVGHLAKRVRRSTPEPVRETGARAVEAVRKNPRKAFAGSSALVGIVAAVRRIGRRSGDDGGDGK